MVFARHQQSALAIPLLRESILNSTELNCKDTDNGLAITPTNSF